MKSEAFLRNMLERPQHALWFILVSFTTLASGQEICEISTKVVPGDLTSFDRMGTSVAISGDGNYAVMGASQFGEGDMFEAGKVYVYARNGTSWQLIDELFASDGASRDEFGYDVDISGDGSFIVVGAYADDNGTGGTNLNRGAIYVYEKSGNSWGNEQKLTPVGLGDYFQFGTSVAVSRDGNYLVGGAPYNNEQVGNGGMLYIYKRSGSSWSLVDKTWHADIAQNDKLGESVDISDDGDYVIAGCRTHEVNGVDMGATYIFKNNGSDVWVEDDQLVPNDGDFFDRFGYSVGIDGNGQYAVIGAKDNNEISADNGAAYVFKNNNGTWIFQQKLLTSNLDDFGQQFGYSVAINSSGDLILIGDIYDDINQDFNTGNAGSVYVFSRTENVWTESSVLIASDRSGGDNFGASLGLADDYLVIGSPNVDDNANDAGAAYFNDYSCWRSPLDVGLLVYYPFNRNANDESGQAADGTPVGATLATDRFDRPDSAYFFDGTGDYIDIPLLNKGNPFSAYSVSGWIYIASMPTVGNRYYFYYNETSDGKIALYVDEGGKVIASHHDSSTWREVSSTTLIEPDKWYHVGLTWDGQMVKLFIDGFQEDELAVSNLQATNIGASIGRQDYWYSVNFRNRGLFHGKIDDLRIYDRALSGVEMAQLNDLPGAEFACAAVPTSAELSFMDGTNPSMDNNLAQGGVLTFPVAIYYMTDDSIPGEGNQEQSNWEQEVIDAFTFVNTLYTDAKIRFEVSFQAIYKNENLTIYKDEIRQQFPYYPNLINIFLVDDILDTNGNSLAGISNFPATTELNTPFPDDRIFINYEYLTDLYTLPHELGHFFGLFHTFQDTECNTPCSTDCGFDNLDPWQTGDRCADTPIDPFNLVPGRIFGSNCFSICSSSFSPIFENVMSYYRKCASNGNATLTQDQKERMYYFATTAREYIWNNNQSDLLTLVSPQYGNYNSAEPADILINLGDNVPTWLDLFYRPTNQTEWIFVETIQAQPGTNLIPAFAPLHFGLTPIEYEYLVQYNNNPAIHDIGAPIMVDKLGNNANYNPLINTDLSCFSCVTGENRTITWNTLAASFSHESVLLTYTTNGVTYTEITQVQNSGSFQWVIPNGLASEYFNIGVNAIPNGFPGQAEFDFLNQNASLNTCSIPQTCCSENSLDIHDTQILPQTYATKQTIQSSGIVPTGSTVVFQAGQSITLQPGFYAEAGSNFVARIADCTPVTMAQVDSLDIDEEPGLDPNLDPDPDKKTPATTLTITPNPFRSEALIRYTLPEDGPTQLILLDMLGRAVVLQPQAIRAAGYQEYRLRSESLSSGIYFVQLRAGEEVITRKVQLLRE